MEENRKTRSSRRGRIMGSTLLDLPSDIIINILSRLPIKSLMRLRCVCKSWHALVSDPNFIDTHLNRTRSNNNGYVLIQHRSPFKCYGGDTFSLHCDETFVEHMELKCPLLGRLKVVGYCHGLLCLSRPGLICRDHDIYLWNPAIRKFRAVPNTLPLGKTSVYLAFGFVPRTNDYKVLKFFRRVDERGNFGPPEVEIYSRRMNSWKRIQNGIPENICYSSMDSVLNGVVHWVAFNRRNYEFILSFDMDNEVFGEMKIPECTSSKEKKRIPDCSDDDSVRDMFVAVLRESLYLFINCEDEGKVRADIWVMKEYGVAESWTKQFTFDKWLEPFSLGFMKDGEVVLRGDDGALVSYDPRGQQVRDLQIHGEPKSVHAFTYYMESLVLLNERN